MMSRNGLTLNPNNLNNNIMANNLIPEELNTLIQEYLTDGVLTDKERAVILRKAEGMGLDRDEIDLYLDAQVQKIDQATDAAARRQKGKTCPYCGGSVPQLTDKCPHCGENITAQASEELQEIFDNLEEALVDMKAGKDITRSKATVERYARKAKMYYGSNPKIQKLLAEIENEIITTEKRIVKEEKKDTVARIIKNPWVWLLVEIVVFGTLFFTFNSMVQSGEKNMRDIEAKMASHPDYDKYNKFNVDKDTSPEYAQLVRDWEEEGHNQWEYVKKRLIFGSVGVIAIIVTVVLGIRKTIKKE